MGDRLTDWSAQMADPTDTYLGKQTTAYMPPSTTSPSGGCLDSAPLDTHPSEYLARSQHDSKYRAWRYLRADDYMPLGSLTIVPKTSVEFRDEWTESTGIQVPVPAEHPLWTDLRILLRAEWIRVFSRRHMSDQKLGAVRIYVLPDDVGRRYLPRHELKPRKALLNLIRVLDKSKQSWQGLGSVEKPVTSYDTETHEDDSLFYLFNTLTSPCPNPSKISNIHSRVAVEELLQPTPMVSGLKTKLYPYQQRSAATMIQRETQPARGLDPRLEERTGPTGNTFYYDTEAGHLLVDKREYDEARGGILAETMGFGKTLICLAAILSTKGHWPQIPPEHSLGLHPIRPSVGSLVQMAAATVGRMQIPWKAHFEAFSNAGESYESCVNALEENIGSYKLPGRVPKAGRRPSAIPDGETIRLCPATLIIVPPNLIAQWQQEISTHVEEDSLAVLVVDSLQQQLPSAVELLRYDIILMHRQRFEREVLSTEAALNKQNKSTPCTCSDGNCNCPPIMPYRSPLRDLHFLRLIADEGHSFASGTKSNAINVLHNLHVERRWIVSGTPANGLLGVEVGIAANETQDADLSTSIISNQQSLLAQRKNIALAEERKDLAKLGYIVADFLSLKPWANLRAGEDYASWHKYVMPTKDGERKVEALKSTLASLVVRHRIEDVEVDLRLPPLHNRVVHLQPCFFDKLSINLFLMVLTANAITSERVDQDYMFHPNNRKDLDHLIMNLRQSGFYWTGFTVHDVTETLRVSQGYLDKEESNPDPQDRSLLEKAIKMGRISFDSPLWKIFGELNEIGLCVENFPSAARSAWALSTDESSRPLFTGATQLGLAQKYVNEHLYASDPAHGLAAAGIAAMEKAWTNAQRKSVVKVEKSSPKKASKLSLQEKTGIPSSSMTNAPSVNSKHTKSRIVSLPERTPQAHSGPDKDEDDNPIPKSPVLKSALKRSAPLASAGVLPESPLNHTRLSGTASAKLSYLLDRVTALHREEKILIFYEGDHIAYYIAQALEIIGVQHLIYASGLTVDRRSAYMTTFNTTETFRVMIMDLRQAAHGLHVACASRVFFVNPVWQPNIEAQAIKRAHRIGQTRPVYVETLVLKDTVEDQMLQRRKAMTSQEHQKAQKSLLDDSTMSDIIKSATFIPISEEEVHDVERQMAPLMVPRPLFNHPAVETTEGHNPDADLILPVQGPSAMSKASSGKRRATFPLELEPDLVPEYTNKTPHKRRKAEPVAFQTAEGILMTQPKSARRKPKKTARFAVADEPEASNHALIATDWTG